MEETAIMDFGEFTNAMGDDGNQTGTGAEEIVEDNETTAQDAQDEPETEEISDGDDTGTPEGDPDNGDPDAPAEQQNETFTLKVNKQEQEVSREDMIAYAQKGVDYDRVKAQNAAAQQTIQDLTAQLQEAGKNREALDVLEIISTKTGSSLEQLAQSLYISVRKSEGIGEETARQELRSAQLEKELNAMKAQKEKVTDSKKDQEERVRKDLEEFREEYPDVELTDDLVNQLEKDLTAGKSLVSAYRKYEKAQNEAKIAELERKLAAKTQNEKNRRNTPGSQNDGGGKRSKDPFSDFMKAFA